MSTYNPPTTPLPQELGNHFHNRAICAKQQAAVAFWGIPSSHSRVSVAAGLPPDDGAQGPLGAALTGGVVYEGYHDDGALHLGRGQLQQLRDRKCIITHRK